MFCHNGNINKRSGEHKVKITMSVDSCYLTAIGRLHHMDTQNNSIKQKCDLLNNHATSIQKIISEHILYVVKRHFNLLIFFYSIFAHFSEKKAIIMLPVDQTDKNSTLQNHFFHFSLILEGLKCIMLKQLSQLVSSRWLKGVILLIFCSQPHDPNFAGTTSQDSSLLGAILHSSSVFICSLKCSYEKCCRSASTLTICGDD